MKIDYSAANRLTPNGTDGPNGSDALNSIEKKNPAHGGDLQTGSLSGKDRASLSEQARLLARAHNVLEETDEQRSERVNALKEQIATGNYEIPVDELARRLASRFKLID
jgi:flagellar biosynthesis anti-sigma factor FlgM